MEIFIDIRPAIPRIAHSASKARTRLVRKPSHHPDRKYNVCVRRFSLK
jgi:hypothetical protein